MDPCTAYFEMRDAFAMYHGHQDREFESRLVVRTVLWIIVGIVAISLVTWWALT